MSQNEKETEETNELHYRKAYLRLFNRVLEIQTSITELFEEMLLEAEDICTDDDDSED